MASGDSFFVTDIDVNNAGDMMATYKVLWLPRDTDNSSPAMSDEVTIGPGETTRWSDVLGTSSACRTAPTRSAQWL